MRFAGSTSDWPIRTRPATDRPEAVQVGDLVADRVVFVPASGSRGSGEVYRALSMARALAARRASLDLHVLLDRSAGRPADAPWTVHPLDATPARDAVAVGSLLEQLAPSLAVFDGSGRTAHLRRVRRLGGRVVWVSNRPGRRRRGFSPRRLPFIDLHLLIGPGRGAAPPGPIERGLLTLFGAGTTLSAQAVAPEAIAPADGFEIDPERPPAVFVSGGGGQVIDGQAVPEVFLEAARRFHSATGWPAWVVLGPRYAGPAMDRMEADGVRVFPSLPTDQLGGLLASARLIVAGAGNMLSNQALLARRPCVMTAVGGHDQPFRLRQYAEQGAVRACELDSDSLAGAAQEVLEDGALAAGLLQGVDRLGAVNDTGRIAGRLLAMI